MSTSRLLREALRSDMTLQRADLYNVRTTKRLVLFDLANGPGELEPVILRASSRADADLLAAALPDQTTRTYSTENRERLVFLERINQLTPHVWATWTITAITLLVFVVMAAHGAGVLRVKAAAAIAAGSNFGPYTQGGQWWRLFTSVFIHFGFQHVFLNMLVLVRFGPIAERLYGSARFVALYVFAGLTGSMVSLLWHPGINSAGASGAIFGLFGAVLAYLARYNDTVPRALYLKNFRLAAAFIIYSLMFGLTHQGIDNGAHLGGLFGGFLLGLLLAESPEAASQENHRKTTLTLGMATALVCGILSGMAWTLTTLALRPDRKEVMHFAVVLQESTVIEAQALATLKTLPHNPSTPESRAAFAGQIRGMALPDWRQLYDSMAAVQVPLGSPAWKVRGQLLNYYGDMSKVLRMTADMADENRLNDPASKATIATLMKNVRSERLEALKRSMDL